MAITETQRQLAIAVLTGDETAVRALHDSLTELFTDGAVPVMPVQRITVPFERLRFVLYIDPQVVLAGDFITDRESIARMIRDWIQGVPIVLQGISRMEVYELPESTTPQWVPRWEDRKDPHPGWNRNAEAMLEAMTAKQGETPK